MTQRELKDKILELISFYFNGATVEWSEQNGVRPSDPLVRLRLDDMKRGHQFARRMVSGVEVSYGQAESTLTVRLFTHGKHENDPEEGSIYINSAVDDLRDMIDFLESQYSIEWQIRNNIAIVPDEQGISDTSSVVDEDFEYSAMVKVRLSFMTTSEGYYGIHTKNWHQTPSGGGTDEQGNEMTSDIDRDRIEITDTYS